MKNSEVTLPHIKLLRAVWGPDSPRDAVYLRSFIKALRKKIEKDPTHPELILTEPWLGYVFYNPSAPDRENGADGETA